LDGELIRSARHDFTTDAETAYRAISPIVVKSRIPILRCRNDQQVEIAVGSVNPFGAAAKQPNLDWVELLDQSLHDTGQGLVFRGEGPFVGNGVPGCRFVEDHSCRFDHSLPAAHPYYGQIRMIVAGQDANVCFPGDTTDQTRLPRATGVPPLLRGDRRGT